MNKLNRREFLGLSALGLAGLTILPSWSINGKKYAPSDRIVMGFIGLGRLTRQNVSRLRMGKR